MGVKLIGASVVIAVAVGVLFADGFVPLACSDENSNGYWHLFGRCISVNDTLYLGSISRAGGLLLGAGFAMLWRPMAILRGPLRDKGRRLDLVAALGIVLLGVLFWKMYLLENGRYNPLLFRGGFLLTGIVTLMVVAAATHARAATGGLLGNKVFNWAGTRSYGLYLYHWPIYQIIRKQAQITLTVTQFVVAMVFTVIITEASYRYIETPIRKGQLRAMVARVRADRRLTIAAVTILVALGLATTSMVMADPQCVGSVQCSLVDNTTDTTSTLPQTETTSGTTAVGQTTEPSTTTTLPPPKANVAIGESVMVGAKAQLESQGVLVNAKENRGPDGVKNAILQLVQEGVIGQGTTVVVQVGTNAPVSDQQFDAIVAAVPTNAAGIVFETVRAPVEWVPGNNERIAALPSRYPQVRVIDWNAESQKIELCPDGIHITCSKVAGDFYANLILTELGLPNVK
jgi:hypothetical protein